MVWEIEYITTDKIFGPKRVAKIKCIEDGSLMDVDILGNRFLLIVLTAGSLSFMCGSEQINASAPCFICFNELKNPQLVHIGKARYHSIYFHPEFLNINMSFELIRSKGYVDIASTHDMFMLKPFLDNTYIVPICDSFVEKINSACAFMYEELREQRDWYWSCRARSYFMEIIIALERMYGMVGYGERDKSIDISYSLKNAKLRNAVLFIESHYMNELSLNDISREGGLNHTSLTKLIKAETGMTVLQYLYFYRVQMAKKQLEFTSVPIKDIAFRTGFKTVQHFNRTFKKIIGETPALFRKIAVQKRKDEI